MTHAQFVAAVTLAWGVSQISLAAGDTPPLLIVDWEAVQARGELRSGEVLAAGDNQPARLRLSNQSGQPITWPVAVITQPPVSGRTYLIRGKIRYENVIIGPAPAEAGYGFLELWNHFPDGSSYFSRTLGVSGPMGRLAGTSDWREFALPFDKGTAPAPTKLELNVVLPGNGSVELTHLELLDDAGLLQPVRSAGAWWDDRIAGIVGGSIGSLLGVIGALVGMLVGMGRGRAFVTVLVAALIPCGLALVATGIVAVAVGQPYAVYYPLLLLGGLSTIFGAAGVPFVRLMYRQRELRRMQALDAQ